MTENSKLRNFLDGLFLVIYLFIIEYFFFIAPFRRASAALGIRKYNLVPFRSVINFFKVSGVRPGLFFINVIGNILVFVPAGLLMTELKRGKIKAPLVVLLSFIFTLAVETGQYFTACGVFDIDDMILNTLGGVAGYYLWRLISLWITKFRTK